MISEVSFDSSVARGNYTTEEEEEEEGGAAVLVKKEEEEEEEEEVEEVKKERKQVEQKSIYSHIRNESMCKMQCITGICGQQVQYRRFRPRLRLRLDARGGGSADLRGAPPGRRHPLHRQQEQEEEDEEQVDGGAAERNR